MKNIFVIALIMTMFGCASMNDALTPGLKIEKDRFDNSLRLYQAPVSSSGIREDWHTLGFEWNETTPEIVYLTVGAQGITNVSGVHFNVNGEIIKSAGDASVNTNYGDFSTRRFYIPIQDFIKIAEASLVKMKVIQIDSYTVSSFGEGAGMLRTIDSKFAPFVRELRNRRVLGAE